MVNENWGTVPVNTNRGPGSVNTSWGPGLENTNWGPGMGPKVRTGSQEKGRGPGNTNTLAFCCHNKIFKYNYVIDIGS